MTMGWKAEQLAMGMRAYESHEGYWNEREMEMKRPLSILRTPLFRYEGIENNLRDCRQPDRDWVWWPGKRFESLP